MLMFGRAALPSGPVPAAFARFAAMAGPDPPSTVQLIGAGWGYAILEPRSVQADNGAGLTRGVIGLVNKGQPRKPDDWGALRADAQGALFDGMMNSDKLHPALKAYQLWADGLKPIFTELLGPPASEDHGPTPTGHH